jgi:hypothetical protein
MSEGYDDIGGGDHLHEDYDAGHAEYGHEQDHALALNELDQQHAAEHDVNFEHGHHEAYANPHEQYEEDDFTKFSEHDAEADSLHALQLNEADHEADFANVSEIEQHIDALIEGEGHGAPALGHLETGHEGYSPVSN